MSPEILEPNDSKITRKCDVYSYSIVLWELFSEEYPNEKTPEQEYIEGIKRGDRPTLTDKIPSSLAAIITSCWSPYPEKRLFFHEIIEANIWPKVYCELLFGVNSNDLNAILTLSIKNDIDHISWIEFRKIFSSLIGCSENNHKLNSLYCILNVDSNNGNVTLENFSHFKRMFGTFVTSDSKASTLAIAYKLSTKKWFWGVCNSSVANQTLYNESIGNFLVRYSPHKLCFIISSREQSRIVHCPLKNVLAGSLIANVKAKRELVKPASIRPTHFLTSSGPSVYERINNDNFMTEIRRDMPPFDSIIK